MLNLCKYLLWASILLVIYTLTRPRADGSDGITGLMADGSNGITKHVRKLIETTKTAFASTNNLYIN